MTGVCAWLWIEITVSFTTKNVEEITWTIEIFLWSKCLSITGHPFVQDATIWLPVYFVREETEKITMYMPYLREPRTEPLSEWSPAT